MPGFPIDGHIFVFSLKFIHFFEVSIKLNNFLINLMYSLIYNIVQVSSWLDMMEVTEICLCPPVQVRLCPSAHVPSVPLSAGLYVPLSAGLSVLLSTGPSVPLSAGSSVPSGLCPFVPAQTVSSTDIPGLTDSEYGTTICKFHVPEAKPASFSRLHQKIIGVDIESIGYNKIIHYYYYYIIIIIIIIITTTAITTTTITTTINNNNNNNNNNIIIIIIIVLLLLLLLLSLLFLPKVHTELFPMYWHLREFCCIHH